MESDASIASPSAIRPRCAHASRCRAVARGHGSPAAAAATRCTKSASRTASLRARLLHEVVAGDHGAAEFAGQRFEPACRIHGGADDGEFEPVQADISQHDLAVMQSDADLDRRLAAMLRARGSIRRSTPIMACAQRSALPASESPGKGVPNVAINPSPRYLSSVPSCRKISRSMRSWNCRSVPITSVGLRPSA